MRPLNSDELGEKGEAEFALFCANDELICNKVGRDRAGWDFIVEFPLEAESEGVFLDQRPQPPDCRAQVKAVWSDTKYISLRLSSAERLAKLVAPAAIFVIVIDNRLKVQELYCIHIMDDALSQILKKIRTCQKNGRTLINREKIRLNYVALGERIEASGISIRNAIKNLCRGSRSEYNHRKLSQIETLGVIGNRFEISFTFKPESEQDHFDFTMGLKNIKVTDFLATEIRWGIALPLEQQAEAEISIKPNPQKGQIKVRSTSPVEAVAIDVEILTAWSLPPAQNKTVEVRLFNDFIEVIIARDERRFSIATSIKEHRALSIKEYMKINTFQRILASNSASLEVLQERKRAFAFPIVPDSIDADHEGLQQGRNALVKLKTILDVAGADDLLLTSSQIYEQVGAIEFLSKILSDNNDMSLDPVKFMPENIFPPDLAITEVLIVGRVPFSSRAIAYCAVGVADITDEADLKVIKINNIKARQISLIGLDTISFDEFDKDMQAETSLRLVLKIDQPQTENLEMPDTIT